MTRARINYFAIAALLPCLVVAYATWSFTYNHFYEAMPFLYDSGWFSQVVHRRGVFLANPPAANPVASYFSFHVSFVILAGSLFSYAFPLDRINWFCVFQAAVTAPIGLCVALLVPVDLRPRRPLFIAGVGLAGFAFAFNGQALACMFFPHYEILLSMGICVMLAGLATERPRLAWTGLALAIATREDGGAHAATFLVAALACDLSGRAFPVRRRMLVVMTVVAALCTVAMMAFQKKVFPAVSLFHDEYLGDPLYGHITAAVLRHRIGVLLDHGLYVVVPFGAAALVALIDRDARWFFGWLVTLPWLLLNLLAVQLLKAQFEIYTGFPFIVSLFWLGAYGVVKYGRTSRFPLVIGGLAAISLASALGAYLSSRVLFPAHVSMMLAPTVNNTPALKAYLRTLRANPKAYGTLMVDPGMGAFVTESLPTDSVNHVDMYPIELLRTDYDRFDAIAFVNPGLFGPAVFNILANGHYPNCGRLPQTRVMYCGRKGSTLPPDFVAVSLLAETLSAGPRGKETGGTLTVDAGDETDKAFHGPWMPLRPARYRATFRVHLSPCQADAHPTARLDAYVHARLATLGQATVTEGADEVNLDFEVTPSAPSTAADLVELRVFSAKCPYRIDGIQLDSL